VRTTAAGTTLGHQNTRPRLAVEISSSAALAASVSPGHKAQSAANSYDTASAPPVAGDDPVNESDPSGLCNEQGNGNAWDLVNPWSPNNPINCWAHKNPGPGSVVGDVTAGGAADLGCGLAPEACEAFQAAVGAALGGSSSDEDQPCTTDGGLLPWGTKQTGPVPDNFFVVKGGLAPPPVDGSAFSGAAGPTLGVAASGVPNGKVQVTTAAAITGSGGTIYWEPEPNRSKTYKNYLHVNVTLNGSNPFSEPVDNPVAKANRIPS